MTIESITGRTHTPPANKANPKLEVDSGKKTSIDNIGNNDSIAITAMAQSITKAFESSSSSVDVDKVASVKKALADGSYQINGERIAEKMIQYEKLML
jgi:negative regulator of flagellin synthesis FlgM